MLVLGPTFIYIICAILFILFVKFVSVKNRTIRVVKEEQLYNREKEESERKFRDRDKLEKEDLNQREALRREERFERRKKLNGQNFRSDFDDEKDSDEGIV
jgi:hypothetical protein